MPVSAFSRYYDSKTIKTPGPYGRKLVTSLTLRLLEEPEEFPDSIIHTVIGEETLDQLSQQYYGCESYWWRITDVNEMCPDEGPASTEPRLFRLQAGDRLVIPPVRTATRFPRR